MKIAHQHSLSVVIGDLLRKEVHVVALREPLRKPRLELCGRKWNGDTALHVERDHAIIKEITLPFDDRLAETVAGHEDGEFTEVTTNELPRAPLSTLAKTKPVFKELIGLVGGDHQIFLNRTLG